MGTSVTPWVGGTTELSEPSTTMMRLAQTAARGAITSIIVAIITLIRICMR